jgi:hypothetical protein
MHPSQSKHVSPTQRSPGRLYRNTSRNMSPHARPYLLLLALGTRTTPLGHLWLEDAGAREQVAAGAAHGHVGVRARRQHLDVAEPALLQLQQQSTASVWATLHECYPRGIV